MSISIESLIQEIQAKLIGLSPSGIKCISSDVLTCMGKIESIRNRLENGFRDEHDGIDDCVALLDSVINVLAGFDIQAAIFETALKDIINKMSK